MRKQINPWKPSKTVSRKPYYLQDYYHNPLLDTIKPFPEPVYCVYIYKHIKICKLITCELFAKCHGSLNCPSSR